MTSLYCSVDNVRSLTGLSATDISDSILSGVIQHATAQINADIQLKREDEVVNYISNEKENDIDGNNTTYYTKYYPIGDRNNDGIINGSDVYAYSLDSDGIRKDYTVSTISNDEIGKITLSAAPTTDEILYFTYYTSPVEMSTPHSMIKLACIQLAAALAFTRIDVSKIQSFRVGKVAVMKQSQAFDIYKRQYYDTINKIRSRLLKVAIGDKTI